MRGRRWLESAALAVAVAGLVLYGPAGCGLIAERAAARALRRAGVEGVARVNRAGLFALRAGPLRLEGDGWRADADSLIVRYTPPGLLGRTVEAVEADGVRIAVTGGGDRADGDAWRDINPAERIGAVFAAVYPWRVGRVALGTVRCTAGAPVAWRLEGAVSGSLAAGNGLAVVSAALSSLKADASGPGGLRANGGLAFTAEAFASGEGARGRLDGNLLVTSRNGSLAGVAGGIAFASLRGEWGAEGAVLGNAFALPSGGVAAAVGGGTVTATGTTFRACDFVLAGGATGEALAIGEGESLRASRAEGWGTLHGRAGEPPRLEGCLTLPRVTGAWSGGAIEAAAGATVSGVWPFETLAGSVTARVVRAESAGRGVRDPVAGDAQWRVSGLTKGTPAAVAWEAAGALRLDGDAVRPFSGPLALGQDAVCDFRVSGSGGAGEAELALRGTPAWHCEVADGVVTGVLDRTEGRVSFGGGVFRAWATGGVERVEAGIGGFRVGGGALRADAEASLEPGGAAMPLWRMRCDAGAERIAATNGMATLDGLRAACAFRGTGAAVEGVEEAALAWSALSAGGGVWEPEGVAAAVTGGVLNASFALRLRESALRAEAAVEVPLGAGGEIRARAAVPETPLAPGDAVCRLAPSAAGLLDVTGGTLAAEAAAAIRAGGAAAVRGSAVVRGLGLRGDGGLWEVAGLDADASFGGTGSGAWTASGRLGVARAAVGKLVATNAEALWRADPAELFIERAQAGWCGGVVRLFAVHADAARRRSDLTLFIDQVQLGEILDLLRAVPGTGQGRLYGRLPLRYEQGRVRLSDGFLYSLPGEGGRVQIHDTAMVEAALKSLDPVVRQQVTTALHDLAYSAFRLDLEPPAAPGGDAVLKLRLAGKAEKRGDLPPVNLDVNLRGPLEALFNMGVRLGR